jgi:hypothetical protein
MCKSLYTTLNLQFLVVIFYLYFSELNGRINSEKNFYTMNLILKNASATLLWILYHVIVRIKIWTITLETWYKVYGLSKSCRL